MCPLWPFHTLLIYGVLLISLWLASCKVMAQVAEKAVAKGDSHLSVQALADAFEVNFCTDALPKELHMDETMYVEFRTNWAMDDRPYVQVASANKDVATVQPSVVHLRREESPSSWWSGAFNVTGVFLGKTVVKVNLPPTNDRLSPGPRADPAEGGKLSVTVTRKSRPIDKAFTISVAVLVAIIFVNFGCALDWELVKQMLRRPVGPLIGMTSQYGVMPLVSFLLAQVLFPGDPAMKLGMFFTGVSPGGGASNVWTCLLGGNLNLSVTMTTISTLAAFFMMPLWIFTLGRLIFDQANLGVPFARISEIAFSLVVPVAIGLLLQRFAPRVSRVMVRILKPFSALLIVFIVVFAIVTNLYIFKLFTWKIVVAGLGLPWLGYTCGLLMALAFKQPVEDILAISVETGVHNTGIAIFMLRFALGQPEADLTTVVPVAIAVMTPVPLMLLYATRFLWWKKVHGKKHYSASGKTSLVPPAGQQAELLTPSAPGLCQQHI